MTDVFLQARKNPIRLLVTRGLDPVMAMRRRLAQIGAAALAAVGCALIVGIVVNTLRQVSSDLPKYGFYSIREIHIMIRDVAYLGDMVLTARLAPDNPNSLAELSKANDFVHIRFNRQDRSDMIALWPRYYRNIDAVRKVVDDVDAVLSGGPPLDVFRLQKIEDEIGRILDEMNADYYEFGNELNDSILESQDALDLLKWEISLALLALSAASIGAALLFANRREALKVAEYLASHDQTTGVRNRTWMSLRGDQLMKQARSEGLHAHVALIDLDHFKEINDTFGHHIGDRVLQVVGQVLSEEAHGPHTVAIRLGGDEFAVIAFAPPRDDLTDFFSALSEALNRPFHVDAHRIEVAASLGVATYPEDGADLETLLRNADHAVYAAKAQGRARIVRFSDKILRRVKALASMETRLKNAILQNDLRLVWQPQFEIASGRLIGAETLVRWNDAVTGETIAPSDFVPVAERSNLILALDRHLLNMAVAQASIFHADAPELTFSVNLSGKSFQDPSLPQYIGELLDKTGLPSDRLEIEITEGVFIGNREMTGDVFAQIADMGVKFAVDDFGTGYSNLAYLADLRLDRLKIDRSFIADVDTSPRKRKLVRSILALAKSLRLEAVAEGVESREQIDFLLKNGCRYAQGFFLSRPLEADVFGQTIRRETHLPKSADLARSHRDSSAGSMLVASPAE